MLCPAGWCSAWKLFALSSPYFLRRALPLGSPAAAGPQSILHGAAAAFVDDCTAYSDESSFAYVTTLSSPQLSSNLRTGRLVCVKPSTWKICLLVKTTWYPGGPRFGPCTVGCRRCRKPCPTPRPCTPLAAGTFLRISATSGRSCRPTCRPAAGSPPPPSPAIQHGCRS